MDYFVVAAELVDDVGPVVLVEIDNIVVVMDNIHLVADEKRILVVSMLLYSVASDLCMEKVGNIGLVAVVAVVASVTAQTDRTAYYCTSGDYYTHKEDTDVAGCMALVVVAEIDFLGVVVAADEEVVAVAVVVVDKVDTAVAAANYLSIDIGKQDLGLVVVEALYIVVAVLQRVVYFAVADFDNLSLMMKVAKKS